MTHRRRQAPVQAGDEDEACERVVVDHGDEQEKAGEDEGDQLAEPIAEGDAHYRRYRRHLCRAAVGRHDDHDAEGSEQVGGHDGQRSEQQVAGDRPGVLDLDAHVERHLDSQ